MDDFYIYYKPETDASLVGTIRAIAPIKLTEMGDMDFIRVPAETGLGFTRGNTVLNNWVVKWNSDAGEMQLTRQAEVYSRSNAPRFIKQIPTKQSKPQVVVTWNPSEELFNVRTRGVSISHPNVTMVFCVTRKDDPNILYHYFTVQLLATMNRKGYDLPYKVSIPDEFSVYTKPDLDRYQLKIER